MYDRAVILEKLRRLKHAYLPDHKLILFGSQARGDANEDSDWDLLIILNKPEREPRDMEYYMTPFTELGWELNEYFSTKIYSHNEWERSKPSLFYKNVQKDGVEIV
ncbi:MAG: nucleotidyltransferase domain-containing protein [Tannerellaceae bacterium]|nr:nucleotidyltransferase domain-containing protein [Tannerellaceae bacterium]